MADDEVKRDEYGNYVNKEGVVIKVSEYGDGRGVKIDFYDKSPAEDGHKPIHTHFENDGKYQTEDNVNGKIEKSKGECYLTSACMRHMKDTFDDNCDELTILRWFRDNFVSKEDTEHYYEIAPIMVEMIDNTNNSDVLYNYIYENVILFCIDAIEQGNYKSAYDQYKNCVIALEENFARPQLEQRFVKALKHKMK